jgi:hypothetical protein
MRKVSVLCAAISCFAGHAYAGLLGSSVVSQYYAYGSTYNGVGSPASFVANGTVQETFCSSTCGEGFTLAVTDTQIDYTMLSPDGYWSTSATSLNSGGLFIANGNLLSFTGVTITGVTLDAASNVPGFTSANITFNSGNIAIDWAGFTGIPQGSQVILDVTTTGSSVPEPAAWITMLAGFAAIAALRLKRS